MVSFCAGLAVLPGCPLHLGVLQPCVGHMEQPGAIPTTFPARPGGWRMLPGMCCQGSSALWLCEEKAFYLKGFGGFFLWAGVQVPSSQGKAEGGGKWKAQQWL